MKKFIITCLITFTCLFISVSAQIRTNVLAQISKAEDELRFDKTLVDLTKSANATIRKRSALALGRIGDERTIPLLVNILETDKNEEVRSMAAFALGEIESIKAADSILQTLDQQREYSPEIISRCVEATGKIAAANPKETKSKQLGGAIVNVLETAEKSNNSQNREVILLGITAVLRAKPDRGEIITAKFLTNSDARIRADAANTLSRLRAKNADEQLRNLLSTDTDEIVRANAARALGAAEDKDSFNLLLESAISDKDSRVRVSAIRSYPH